MNWQTASPAALAAVQKIIDAVRKDTNYVPREHKTIGGMWTVDTWKLDCVTLQLMDEGYTNVIIAGSVTVAMRYAGGQNELSFEHGAEPALIELARIVEINEKARRQ